MVLVCRLPNFSHGLLLAELVHGDVYGGMECVLVVANCDCSEILPQRMQKWRRILTDCKLRTSSRLLDTRQDSCSQKPCSRKKEKGGIFC